MVTIPHDLSAAPAELLAKLRQANHNAVCLREAAAAGENPSDWVRGLFAEAELVFLLYPEPKAPGGLGMMMAKGKWRVALAITSGAGLEVTTTSLMVTNEAEAFAASVVFGDVPEPSWMTKAKSKRAKQSEKRRRPSNPPKHVRICDIDFDHDLLLERSRLPYADLDTILPPWWEIACGNAVAGVADRSTERYVRRLFHDYDVVWGLYPDPDRPGRFEALLLDGGGAFTGVLKPADGDSFMVTAWHCKDLAQAKAIAMAFSKDAEESMTLSIGVQYGLLRDYEQTGDCGGPVGLF